MPSFDSINLSILTFMQSIIRYFLLPDRAVSGKDQPILGPSQSREGSDYRENPCRGNDNGRGTLNEDVSI